MPKPTGNYIPNLALNPEELLVAFINHDNGFTYPFSDVTLGVPEVIEPRVVNVIHDGKPTVVVYNRRISVTVKDAQFPTGTNTGWVEYGSIELDSIFAGTPWAKQVDIPCTEDGLPVNNQAVWDFFRRVYNLNFSDTYFSIEHGSGGITIVAKPNNPAYTERLFVELDFTLIQRVRTPILDGFELRLFYLEVSDFVVDSKSKPPVTGGFLNTPRYELVGDKLITSPNNASRLIYDVWDPITLNRITSITESTYQTRTDYQAIKKFPDGRIQIVAQYFKTTPGVSTRHTTVRVTNPFHITAGAQITWVPNSEFTYLGSPISTDGNVVTTGGRDEILVGTAHDGKSPRMYDLSEPGRPKVGTSLPPLPGRMEFIRVFSLAGKNWIEAFDKYGPHTAIYPINRVDGEPLVGQSWIMVGQGGYVHPRTGPVKALASGTNGSQYACYARNQLDHPMIVIYDGYEQRMYQCFFVDIVGLNGYVQMENLETTLAIDTTHVVLIGLSKKTNKGWNIRIPIDEIKRRSFL